MNLVKFACLQGEVTQDFCGEKSFYHILKNSESLIFILNKSTKRLRKCHASLQENRHQKLYRGHFCFG